MKLRALKFAMALAGVFLITGILYAANDDRFAAGNHDVGSLAPDGNAAIKEHMNAGRYLGADTAAPGGKAEISDNSAVDGNSGVDTNTTEEKEK